MIILPRPLSIPAVEASLGSGSIGRKSSGNNVVGTNSNDKVIMINFDDSYKTQMLYAKPILNQGYSALSAVCSTSQ